MSEMNRIDEGFVHLDVNTQYSLGKSVVRIDRLIELCEENKMPAVGVTDHNNLFSAFKAYKASQKQGIKLIIGSLISIKINNDTNCSKLILLCENQTGYKNLCYLITKSYIDGFKNNEPFIEINWLEGNSDGLIAISAYQDGVLNQIRKKDNQKLKNLINTMTNILEMFGVDFGEGGTFLSKAGEIISSLTVNMINKWNDFKQGVKDTWNGLVNFFTGEDGYVKTTIRNIKETMQNAWDTFVLGVKVSWNNTTTKVKETVSSLLEPLTVTLPNKIGEIKDGLIDTWNNIKSKVMEALTNVSLWFMFKPKELGLLLEEKWIETKGAFMEKLASFAGLLTTIPAQLKLLSLKTIRDIPGGKFLVSDNRIANAQREVNQGQAFASAILESTLSKTQEDLARIARERKELEAQKTQMEEAAKFLISQNNPTTTITTTNLNPNAGAVGDPYANSYMGRHVAGP